MIILGVDPGTATTGYGLIKQNKKTKSGDSLQCLGYGLIQTSPSSSPAERLKKISKELNQLIKKYQPKVLAVENVYFFKNLKTALPVSQAKGVIMLAAANKNIPIYEFTPLQVKMAIAGYGRADKKQIQEIVKNELNLKEVPKPDDAADALAIAICCEGLLKKKESQVLYNKNYQP
ncbi:MAG: crossover junction endodeoxyribonuclease RuvC [Candidatus Nealsonbacteria bacterium RBG_13_36_15]|uniref:Crossover junction endodeoxyribonuclease RuvC n=1 Tax=Candidatus Nealsonbacteria bacterium RBG_13_36_15 TaxID=1801660 RepID=A0A1G2DXM7_9BACT|nr:MAG: crossover junction endodeoxyribonuclease RuvC [Candidatus Nealsonbacteria bacterium RBG_13_36_15]